MDVTVLQEEAALKVARRHSVGLQKRTAAAVALLVDGRRYTALCEILCLLPLHTDSSTWAQGCAPVLATWTACWVTRATTAVLPPSENGDEDEVLAELKMAWSRS